jgi:hypothetical protein
MRVLLALITIALLTMPAYAQQGAPRGPGAMEQRQQSEQQRKKAAEAEKAYKAGLEKIPNTETKPDPWGDLRSTDTGKSNAKSK